MATRSKAASADTALSADEIAIRQQHLCEKERRLRDEQRALEDRRVETENTARKYEQSLAEFEENRALLREERDSALCEAEKYRNQIAQLQQALRSKERSPPAETRRVSPSPRERSFYGSEWTNFGLREALELVPVFDGTNVPVLQFSRACLRARNIVAPAAEQTLTQLIYTKLRGRALSAVEDEVLYTVSELCDRLKDVFGSYRTVDHYRGDLANIFMRPSEHILDYIARVKDLRSAILDTTHDNTPTRSIDKFVSRCFIDGLVPFLRVQIRDPLDDTLNGTYDEAIRAFKRSERDRERYEDRTVRFSGTSSGSRDRRFGRSPSPRNSHSEESTGRRYDSPGRYREHSERTFRKDTRNNRHGTPDRETRHHASSSDYRQQRRDAAPQEQRYVERRRDDHRDRETGRAFSVSDTQEDPQIQEDRQPRDSIKCRYCKIRGHDIHECRKREAANKNRSGNEDPLPSGH